MVPPFAVRRRGQVRLSRDSTSTAACGCAVLHAAQVTLQKPLGLVLEQNLQTGQVRTAHERDRFLVTVTAFLHTLFAPLTPQRLPFPLRNQQIYVHDIKPGSAAENCELIQVRPRKG